MVGRRMEVRMENRLIYGDCLEVMREMPAGFVDLCYLDPPFNSKTNYNILFKNSGIRGVRRKSTAQLIAFEDTWTWNESAAARVKVIENAVGHPAHNVISGLFRMLGPSGMLAYLSYMAERLAEIRRVLKRTGAVYLHCDRTASHYLKIVMDHLFGAENFVDEIIWNYGTPSGGRTSGKKPIKAHEVLLVYAAKYGEHVYNRQYTDYDRKYVENWFRHDDGDGRKYRTRSRSGVIIKQYLDESHGVPLSTVWTDIMQIYGQSGWFPTTNKEGLGYPTQKPLALLERIILMASNEGDVVLDPFCGCGTTIEAADKLRRQWIGIDISPFAIDMIRNRRLPRHNIPVEGIPVDMQGAEQLAKSKPFDFEKWAITRIPGMIPNSKQVGDRGIDGRGRLLYPMEESEGLILAQVKGGHQSPGQFRDFLYTVEREEAALGVYVTLDKISSPSIRAEAAAAGTVEIGAASYPKVQLWSMEDYFDDRPPLLPPLADPYTGKAMAPYLRVGGTEHGKPQAGESGLGEAPMLPLGGDPDAGPV